MGRKAFQGIVIIVATMFFLSFATFTEAVAGGEPAKPGEFPHVVELYSFHRQHHFCGGSIIAPSVILTAAHCLFDVSKDFFGNIRVRERSVESILVTAGTLKNREWTQFQEEEEGQSRFVDRYVIHPEYQKLHIDIALVILEKPLIYNDKVQPIQLPPPNAIFPRGTLAGWGYTDGSHLSSPYLKKLELVLEDRQSCNSDPLMTQDGFKVTELELCANMKKTGRLCQGDSGSSLICQRPALVNDQQNKSTPSPPSIICGIASWVQGNQGCGKSDVIGVFVDVSQYLDWIQNTMEAEGFGKTNPLPCSGSEGFFDCGEFGKDGKKIKSRCILIKKKCDGVNNCGNGRDENETICAAKDTSESASKPEQNATTTEETAEKDPEGTQKMETGTTSEPEPGRNEKEKENTAENDLEATSTPKPDEPEKTNEEEAQIETGSTSEPEQDKRLEENAENNDLEATSTPKLEPVKTNDEETQTNKSSGQEKVCVWLFLSFTTLILLL